MTIGAHVIIEDGVRIQNSAIFSKSVIRSHAWLNNCIVGWRSTVGRWVSFDTRFYSDVGFFLQLRKRLPKNLCMYHNLLSWFCLEFVICRIVISPNTDMGNPD